MTRSDPVARSLAAAHPDAALPCPRCAGAVKGVNLDRHLAKVHPDASGVDAARPAWSGPERLVARPLAALPLLFAAGVIAWSWRTDRELRPWFLAAAAAVALGLLLTGLAVADTGVFRGRLSLRGDGVRLRHTLGLFTRTLRTVDRIECGSAYRTRPDSTASMTSHPDVNPPGIEERAGVYLRLFDGRRSITVHCRNNTGLRKTWTGWQPGPRRRRWSITLRPADFVGLQYALAASGRLQLRAG